MDGREEMSHAVGGLAPVVVPAPGRGERCNLTDNAVVSLRLDVVLRTGDAGCAQGSRRDERNASPQWLKEAAALD